MANAFETKSALSPRNLAESSVSQWTIPIYQRLLVWEEEQIRQLLDDLDTASRNTPGQPYYIGIFTIVAGKDNTWTVVDGQQRLTFLSLFAAWCIRTGVRADEWRRFLRRSDGAFRISYFGREEETKDLQGILDGQATDTLQTRNFRIFCDCIVRKQKEWEREQRPLDAYAHYVFEQAAFLVSMLPDTYAASDLNRFFERMNAAGRQLSVIDQIRGRHFPTQAGAFDRCLDFERVVRDGAPDAKNPSGVQEVSVLDSLSATATVTAKTEAAAAAETGARSVLAPEVMLLHVLELTIGAERVLHDPHRILATFKQDFPHDLFLANLKAYRTWLDEHVIYLDSADDTRLEYKLRNAASEKPDTEPQELQEHNARRKLVQFQSMLYVASDPWQGWVLRHYRSRPAWGALDAAEELQALKEHNRRELPPLASLRYGQIDRYWFWALDYILWEQAMDGTLTGVEKEDLPAIKAYRFRRNRSIEHLHPQTSDNPWDENDLHGFGNLAMISASFNSTQGNDSVGVKFARVKDTQLPAHKLESIKLLLMFRAAKDETGWTTDNAKHHGEAMYKLLESVYSQNLHFATSP